MRWLRETSLEELQKGYWLALGVAQLHGSRHWIMDVRRRSQLAPESAAWIAESFLPTAAARFAPHRLHIAYLTCPQRIAVQRADERLRQLTEQTLEASPAALYVVHEEKEATEWLRVQQ